MPRIINEWSLLVLVLTSGMLLAAEPVADHGIPSVPIDVSQDVRTWWAHHPLNPAAEKALTAVKSPEPVVELQPGDSIDAAIEKLPATGGTLRLAAGRYAPFQIIGRSHIHILGPETGEAIITGHSYLAVCPEAMDYVQFDRQVSHVDQVSYKDERVWKLYCAPPRDFYLKRLVFDGELKTEADFPGVGIQGPGGALGLKRVRDVLVEDCVFRNFLDTNRGLQHCGLAWGHYGLDNVWFRRCQFLGTAKYAVYLDGAHGCGLVDCTFEGTGCKAGGLLFLANHDFTDDLNQNGRIDAAEERCAKLVVISGNKFAGNFSAPIRLTGQNCLITGNEARGIMAELVGVYPTGEVAHRNWKPGYWGIRVTDNDVGTCVRALVNIFELTPDKLLAAQSAPLNEQYAVEQNAAIKSPTEVLFTPLKP